MGFILGKEIAKRVTEIEKISDRLIMIKLEMEPVCLVLIQVYMPTSDSEDEEVEEMRSWRNCWIIRKEQTVW